MNNGNHFTYQLLQLNYLTILRPRMSARLPLVTAPIIAPIVKTDLVQSYLAASSRLAFDLWRNCPNYSNLSVQVPP
jgi:hypothetical protein